MPEKSTINVGIVDDHILLRIALSDLISGYDYRKSDYRYDVSFQADNGKDMINKLSLQNPPDIILLDVHMPEMDGFQTAQWLNSYYPWVRVIAISRDQSEYSVVQMLGMGVKGYLAKNVSVEELMEALNALVNKGYYYPESIVKKLVTIALQPSLAECQVDGNTGLNEREKQFLRMVCTEWSYKEIADKMLLSPRTIDGYRDSLFFKLNVKTRVGLIMYAIKNGIVEA